MALNVRITGLPLQDEALSPAGAGVITGRLSGVINELPYSALTARLSGTRLKTAADFQDQSASGIRLTGTGGLLVSLLPWVLISYIWSWAGDSNSEIVKGFCILLIIAIAVCAGALSIVALNLIFNPKPMNRQQQADTANKKILDAAGADAVAVLRERFRVHCATLSMHSVVLHLENGKSVALCPDGVHIARYQADEHFFLPRERVQRVAYESRLVASNAVYRHQNGGLGGVASTAMVGGLLFGETGAIVGAVAGQPRLQSSAESHTYTHIVDLYTSVQNHPVITVDFGPEEQLAKSTVAVMQLRDA